MYSSIIPYALLQVCLLNRREYRVVAVNGKVAFISINNLARNRGKAFSNQDDILMFAQRALDMLKVRCLGAMTDFIIRIDVMINNYGVLVVNEFESFEAATSTNDFCMLEYFKNSVCEYLLNKLTLI